MCESKKKRVTGRITLSTARKSLLQSSAAPVLSTWWCSRRARIFTSRLGRVYLLAAVLVWRDRVLHRKVILNDRRWGEQRETVCDESHFGFATMKSATRRLLASL